MSATGAATTWLTEMVVLRCPSCGGRYWWEWPAHLPAPEWVVCERCDAPVHTTHDRIEERRIQP